MKTAMKVIGGVAAVLAVLSLGSCFLFTAPPDDLVAAAKELKTVIPAIQAGMSLVTPDDPAERALTPANLKTSGATTGNNWGYGAGTPAVVYGAGTATKRFPASGNYEYDVVGPAPQCYFTLTPEPSLGATYYRMVLYTFPAIDLSVAYTIEEYIVNAAGDESWAWGNLNLAKQRDSWISLSTAYLDGTMGARTVNWVATTAPFYPAFTVGEPDPTNTASFVGYRNEESETPPVASSGSGNFSSSVTEVVKGKGANIDGTQYYTETSATVHSGLTYVFKDKKRKWSQDTYIVTRMEEDTAAGTKKIRSVGEVGEMQYYIDKVDIGVDGLGKVTYTSSHDVYDTALPRGGNPKAKDYTSLDVLEDGVGLGTFTGTMTETQNDTEIVRDVKIDRDNHYRFRVSMKYKSSGTRPRALADDIEIPLTKQDLANLVIPLSGVNATFNGYYEAGSLFGTVTAGSRSWELIVTDEGVAFDDVLKPY